MHSVQSIPRLSPVYLLQRGSSRGPQTDSAASLLLDSQDSCAAAVGTVRRGPVCCFRSDVAGCVASAAVIRWLG